MMVFRWLDGLCARWNLDASRASDGLDGVAFDDDDRILDGCGRYPINDGGASMTTRVEARDSGVVVGWQATRQRLAKRVKYAFRFMILVPLKN